MAISRKGNVGNVHAPAHLPAGVPCRPALPTASPRIGHDVISSVSREIPCGRNDNNRTCYAAGRGRPALPTASPRIGHDVISSVSREIPRVRTGTTRTRASQMPAGAPCREIPSNRNENTRTRLPQNTCPQGFPAGSQRPYVLYNTFFNFANERRYNLTLRRGGGIISP